ncbi:MAG: endonuclease domain-containing protein [Pseudonocardiaceae bacterium]
MGTRWGFKDLGEPFRGSAAVDAGVLTPGKLRGEQFRRIFRDVYVPAALPLTHEIRCQCAALVLPTDAVITGRSAATLRGVPLARTEDPVEAVVGLETRVFRRTGLDLRRCEVRDDEAEAWSGIRLATRQRMAFDLLLDRPLPDAVPDLDAALRGALVGREEMQRYLTGRHDRGIVQARCALELADPRAESHPESQMRVYLVMDGLRPEVQYRIYHRGRFVGRADLALPEHRLAVEYDGMWHGVPLQVGRDRDRLNRLHAAGWDVVFITAQHLREPRRLIHTVRAALNATMATSIHVAGNRGHGVGRKVVRWGARVPGAFGARSSCWSCTPGRRYSTRER